MFRNGYFEVNFVERKTTQHTRIFEDKFCIDKTKKHVWLQNICCSILQWLGCNAQEQYLKVTWIVLKEDDIINYIQKQIYNISGEYYPDKPRKIYIGCEEFEKLTGAVATERVFNIMDILANEIYGVKFEVIPWMKGVLVV